MAYLSKAFGKPGLIKSFKFHTNNFSAVLYVQQANASSGAMREQINTWKKASELFNSPERDTKSFPSMPTPQYSPPTRIGFISEKLFIPFLQKTGVTGPYVLGTGLITFLISKEIWVLNHHFAHFLSFWILMGIIQAKAGPTISKMLDTELDQRDDAFLYKPVRDTKAAVANAVAEIETVIGQNETKLMVPEIKKENVNIQLEAIYRKRLSEVHQAVKKRLDYQLDMQNTRERFEQDYMLQWIVSNVNRSLTPQHEKEAMGACISRLKELSKTASL